MEEEIIQGTTSGQQRRGRSRTHGRQYYKVNRTKGWHLAASSWRKNKLADSSYP